MPSDLRITRLTVTHYTTEFADLQLEETLGFDTVYKRGGKLSISGSILTVETNAGVTGETPGGVDARTARYLLGRNPLQREIIIFKGWTLPSFKGERKALCSYSAYTEASNVSDI